MLSCWLWRLVFSMDGVGNPSWTWPEILLSTEKPLKTGARAMRWRTKFHFNTWRCTAQLIMLTLENISSYKSALHRGVERWPMGNYSGLLNLYCYGRITQSTGQEILQQLCRCVLHCCLLLNNLYNPQAELPQQYSVVTYFYMDILRFTMVFWEAQLHTKYCHYTHCLIQFLGGGRGPHSQLGDLHHGQAVRKVM